MTLNGFIPLALGAALAGAGCDGGEVTVTPSRVPAGNTFFATWEIQSTRLGPVRCEQVAAAHVDLDLRDTATGERVVYSFGCGAYQGTSGEVGLGTYDVVLDLVDAERRTLAETALGSEDLRRAGTIDLGHRVFVVP